jgi:hypothetical protein
MSRLEDVREKCMLLGMVYSEEQCPKRGQEYRDRVRCESLENIGYKVSFFQHKLLLLLLLQCLNA